MPSLVSPTERANLTGIFNDVFDTFQRAITVCKEPTKVPRQSADPNNFVYGFGDSQTEDAYTYIPNTGVFSATIRYAGTTSSSTQNQFKPIDEANVMLPEGYVSIKVKRDCRDYINSGKTEKIIIDEKNFLPDSDERKQTFLDSEFWVFILKPTK